MLDRQLLQLINIIIITSVSCSNTQVILQLHTVSSHLLLILQLLPSPTEKFVIAVTCFSQCHDVIKCLLVARLPNTFSTSIVNFSHLHSSVEIVTNRLLLHPSMMAISLVFNYFQKQMRLYYTVNTHPFDCNCSNQLSLIRK